VRSTFEGFKAFAEEIERIEKVKQDLIVPMGKVAMVDPDRLALNGAGEFGITENGHRQLAQKVGIPFDYYQRTRDVPGLREQNVNGWLQKDPAEKKLVRVLDGNVRAVLGPRYKPMDNFALMDAISPALGEIAAKNELMMKTFALSENHLYLQIVFKGTMVELRPPSDPFKDGHYLKEPIKLMAGMTIRNSETGHAARDFRKTVWNLVCWNGAITESVLRNYHVGRELDGDDNGNIWTEETLRAEVELLRLKTRDIIRDAMDPASLTVFVDQAKASFENRITVPMDELIVNVTRRWGFTKAEGQKLMENVLEGGADNKTQWGLSQGINALAHVVDSTDRQYDLEKLSADVVALKPSEWKVIAN
jgi:hypothetical protein